MLVAVGRLHQRTREEVVHGGIAAGIGVAPGHALGRGEAICGDPSRGGIHADVGIEQDVRAVGEDFFAPALTGQRPLHEAVALPGGDFGLGVAIADGVVAEDFELAAIKLAEPTPDHQLPNGVVAEEAADDADADFFAGRQRRRYGHGGIFVGDDFADQRAVLLLQIAVVVTLIGQVERLVGADRGGEIARNAPRFDIIAELLDAAAICAAAAFDFGFVEKENGQLRHAEAEAQVSEIGPERQGALVMLGCVAGSAFRLEHAGDCGLRADMIGRQRERLLIAVNGFRRTAGAAQSGGEAAVHFDVIGLEGESALVMRDRFVEPVRFLEGGSEITECADVLGAQRDCALPAGERHCGSTLFGEGLGEIAVSGSVVGFERYRLFPMRLRLIGVAALLQGATEIVVRFRICGLDLDGSPQQLDRLVGTAQLQRERAQKLEAVGVIGSGLEDAPVDRLGLDGTPGPVVGEGELCLGVWIGCIRRGCRRDRRVGCGLAHFGKMRRVAHIAAIGLIAGWTRSGCFNIFRARRAGVIDTTDF